MNIRRTYSILPADRLLAKCERDSQSPCYSEDAFHWKLKLANRRDPMHAEAVQCRSLDPLLWSELRGMLDLAHLTDRQKQVLERRMDGWTFEEIGRSAGHSRQSALNVFAQAMRKLTRAYRVYSYRGLSAVYREETNRGYRRTCGRINR